MAKEYLTYASSRKGASHTAHGGFCQDASVNVDLNIGDWKYNFISVADGHGSKKYDMSHVGSALAIASATDVFFRFSHGTVIESLIPEQIITGWKERVKNHYISHFVKPMTCWMFLETIDPPYSPAIEYRYGTTLVSIFHDGDYFFIFQIGDGNCVAVMDNGSVKSLTDEDSLVGGETYSLCSKDIIKHCSIKKIPDTGIKAIFASTDGLINSFDTDAGFHNVLKAILGNIEKYGFSSAMSVIPGYLDRYTNEGSGDDISLAVMVKVS